MYGEFEVLQRDYRIHLTDTSVPTFFWFWLPFFFNLKLRLR